MENDEEKTAEESVKPDIRPKFLGNKRDDAGKKRSGDSNNKTNGNGLKNDARSTIAGGVASARGLLGAAEKNASNNLGTGGVASFINSVGQKDRADGLGKKSNLSLKKKIKIGGATVSIFGIVAVMIILIIFVTPVVMLGSLDYGLQLSLGYDELNAILEEQAGYVVKNNLSEGSFNSNYANDLAMNGVEVGQVTAIGNFVRTNTYLADLDGVGGIGEIAASEKFYDNEGGELVIRFENEVITADDLIGELETNPRFYAAFAKATDIKGRFWYDSEVDKYLSEVFNVKRNAFANYSPTGDKIKDEEQFEEMLKNAIGSTFSADLGGCGEEDGGCSVGSFNVTSSEYNGKDGGKSLVQSVASNTKGDDATQRSFSILNAAISANEPYIAARTFAVIEEVLNRARIDGDGPVEPMMNAASEVNEVTVTNVQTSEDMVVRGSMLNTQNVSAAVSNHGYSVEDAANYSRDSIINMAKDVSGDVIKDTTVWLDQSSKKSGVFTMWFGQGEADSEKLQKASNRLSTTFYDDTLTMTKSAIGGNRLVMGGSYLLAQTISDILAARASDRETVQSYKKEADKMIARKANAERMTMSPFDVSSRNTFLGSLVGKIGEIGIRNVADGVPVGESLVSSVADLFDESFKTVIVSDALAEVDDSYTNTDGNCPTSNGVYSVVGDIYCTEHNTIDTTRMDWTLERYAEAMPESIDENGTIKEDGLLAENLKYGAREVTVGVEAAEICERWKEEKESDYSGILSKLKDGILNVLGLYDSCREVDESIANGGKYTMSKENEFFEEMSLYSSYVLYDKVSSLLNEKKSSVAEFKEKYYAEHPLDKSAAGVISRRSGMSKAEAEVALAYYSYLDYIAHYRPEERYAFIDADYGLSEMMPGPIVENQRLQAELAIASREVFYRDLRTLATFSI